MECEVCGKSYPPNALRYVSIEGATLRACPRCAARGTPVAPPAPRSTKPMSRPAVTTSVRPRPITSGGKRSAVEELEVVEDYAERIREAREVLGWTQQFLARKLNERESFIKNIESGHMSPPMEIAKKLETLLKIHLLERPSKEEETAKVEKGGELTLGDIVDVKD